VNQSVTRDVSVAVQPPAATATPSVPTINSFTASSASLVLGQPITLTWSTSNVTTQIDLLLNGLVISSDLPKSASALLTPNAAGTMQYQLLVAPLSGGSAITATVTVQVSNP
jgi:hypothetical protein